MDSTLTKFEDLPKGLDNVPTEVLENIFENLRVKELIKITLVCSRFNEVIGSSPKFMNKIRLRAGSDVKILNEIFEKTKRTYQHLSLFNAHCDSEEHLDFFSSYSKWKSVRINRCIFYTSTGLYKLFTTIAETLEELNIDALRPLQRENEEKCSIYFPKLTSLKFNKPNSRNVLETIDFQCSKLKILTITVENMDLIRTNQEIEELELEGSFLDVFDHLDVGLHEILQKLKLKKLIIIIKNNPNKPRICDLRTFLKSQSETVKEVEINLESFYDQDHIVLPVFEELKNLQKLIISGDIDDGYIRLHHLIPNPNITELRLRFQLGIPAWIESNIYEISRMFITSCPNLKHLYVHNMNQELLDHCSVNLKHLESIFAFSFKSRNLSRGEVGFEEFCKRFNFRQKSLK